jgi:hypothetical protein
MDKKAEKLRGGVAVLFGEAPASQPQRQEEREEAQQRETDSLIETVQDEELKEKLRQRQLEGRGRPKRGRPHDSKTEGYGAVCVKANLEKWEKLRYISLQESLQLKEVLELALDMLIQKYEAEKGAIQLKPQTKSGNVFNK